MQKRENLISFLLLFNLILCWTIELYAIFRVFRTHVSFWAHLQSFPHSPFFVRQKHALTPALQPQNPWLSHFLTLRRSHLEQSPPRHQALYNSPFLQKQSQDISLLRIFDLSNTISLSVCGVCVCVCVCVCVLHIVTLEHLLMSTLCISFR